MKNSLKKMDIMFMLFLLIFSDDEDKESKVVNVDYFNN